VRSGVEGSSTMEAGSDNILRGRRVWKWSGRERLQSQSGEGRMVEALTSELIP
jgi:hypothetical protein